MPRAARCTGLGVLRASILCKVESRWQTMPSKGRPQPGMPQWVTLTGISRTLPDVAGRDYSLFLFCRPLVVRGAHPMVAQPPAGPTKFRGQRMTTHSTHCYHEHAKTQSLGIHAPSDGLGLDITRSKPQPSQPPQSLAIRRR